MGRREYVLIRRQYDRIVTRVVSVIFRVSCKCLGCLCWHACTTTILHLHAWADTPSAPKFESQVQGTYAAQNQKFWKVPDPELRKLLRGAIVSSAEWYQAIQNNCRRRCCRSSSKDEDEQVHSSSSLCLSSFRIR
jgi:hypothetical protein